MTAINWPNLLALLLTCLECASLTNAQSNVEICGANGYNIQNLTTALYWYYEPLLDDVADNCPNNTVSCRYSFAVCNSLPSDFNCSDCSIALSVNGSNDEYTSIGSYNSSLNPIVTPSSDYTTFSIWYTNGTPYSILQFTCDLSVKWIVADGDKISRVPDSAQTKIQFNSPVYTFNFLSAEACYIPPTVIPFEPSGGLSTGSILLLIFFPTLAIYFILGIVLNKLGGATGKELIPNYEFWNSLPDLIADGVVFSWSMITCQGSKGVSGYDSI